LVTLGVDDLARARAFYEALGWTGESEGEDVVFFQAGGMVVALWDRVSLAEDSGAIDDGTGSSVTLAHNVGSPDDVDRVLEEAASAGATIVRLGAPTFWGGYSGLFKDVDGHPWEVAHNPGWPIAADGSISLH
jgi:predicted lactoylglutathione lyase